MKIKLFNNKVFQIISVIVGIITLMIALYDVYVSKNDANLVFDVLTNTEIFSTNENLENIKIYYGDENLITAEKKISIISVSIKNQGDIDIRSEDIYRESFGFKVLNSKILDSPKIISYTNSIFQDYLNIKLIDTNQVKFDALPINAKQGFTIKLFVLSEINEEPEIIPEGYISGLGEIVVNNSYDNEEDTSILDSRWFQIYSLYIGLVMLLLLLIFLISSFKNFIKSRKRAKEAFAYLKQRKSKSNDHIKWIYITHYSQLDVDLLVIREIWDDQDFMFHLVEFIVDFKAATNKKLSSNYKELRNYKNEIFLGSNLQFIEEMIQNGQIKKEGDLVKYHGEFFDEFIDFTDFLKHEKDNEIILEKNIKV